MNKTVLYSALAMSSLLIGSAANAKVNYTAKDGRTMCCTSVGPSGWAAQGCTANPSGGQCAAIKNVKTEFDIDKIGHNGAARKVNTAAMSTKSN